MALRDEANLWQLCSALDRAEHGGRVHVQPGALRASSERSTGVSMVGLARLIRRNFLMFMIARNAGSMSGV